MCKYNNEVMCKCFVMPNGSEVSVFLYRLLTAAHLWCLPPYFLLDQKVSRTQDPCLHADPHVSLRAKQKLTRFYKAQTAFCF